MTSWLELSAKPHPGHGPLATDGRRRDAERRRRFRAAEAREVAQLDEPGLLRVQDGEPRESIIQCDQIDRIERRIGGVEVAAYVVECDAPLPDAPGASGGPVQQIRIPVLMNGGIVTPTRRPWPLPLLRAEKCGQGGLC